jgi:hypothetical protein
LGTPSKRNKAYKPGRFEPINTLAFVQARIMPMSDSQNLQYTVAEWDAFSQFLKGCANPHHWIRLTTTANVLGELSRVRQDGELVAICAKAHEALRVAAIRYHTKQVYSFDGSDLQAVRKLLAYAEEQRQTVTLKEYQAAEGRVAEAITKRNAKVTFLARPPT